MADRSFLLWPFFEDAHRRLADDLESWAEASLSACDADDDNHNDDALDAACRAHVHALGEAGFLRFCVPEDFGGAYPGRLDVRSLCLMREGLARRSGLADFAFAMQGLGSGPITLFGNPDLKARYLPPVAAGKHIAAFALSEPEAGSNAAALQTTATRDGDAYVLNGKKTWISNAGLADHYIIFARTDEAPGAKGVSAFVVDAETPGLSVTKRLPVIAPHPLGELTLDNCRVSATQLLAVLGAGLKVALSTLDIFRSTVGAAALGFARRALDEALGWSLARNMGNGDTLFDKQLPQAHLADAATRVDASALLIYRAAWTKDSGQARVSREASMAKLFATEEAQKVIDSAVQLLGGSGVISGAPVEKLYREIRALRIYEGASDIQKLIIAGQLKASFSDLAET